MKVAIMQPYLLPYIGYFQLINAVDQFVIYDNIQYAKKGWINRNRFLQNDKAAVFSIPLKKDSDYLDIRERSISSEFNKIKLLNQIREAYRKAPYFESVYLQFEKIVMYDNSNLFAYLNFSIQELCNLLSIKTKIIISSTINIDHKLKAQDKVIEICRNLCADTYINAIGGQKLYSYESFKVHNIKLLFLKSQMLIYKQFSNEFIPWLSILDLLMFNTKEDVISYLEQYELLHE